MDDLKETSRGWDLKEEALDHTVCRTRFGWCRVVDDDDDCDDDDMQYYSSLLTEPRFPRRIHAEFNFSAGQDERYDQQLCSVSHQAQSRHQQQYPLRVSEPSLQNTGYYAFKRFEGRRC